MRKIAILHSRVENGSLVRLAESLAAGARRVPGTTAALYEVAALTDKSWKELAEMDAIVFGAPVFRGGANGEFEAFAKDCIARTASSPWKGKLAGGLVSGGAGRTEDRDATQKYFADLAAKLKMTWLGSLPYELPGLAPNETVAERLESWRTSMANMSPPTAGNNELVAAETYGKQVAAALAALPA